ncbi:Flp family type IVb pilin [Aureimonas jatrophae]|uniref:Pilus assembly protein Flp/PilA n=1 Tax=Aureimonas jatrophae TaxID=1166073 RepID=A0A1H0LTL8_9HYPH|nr:Flp family type IVb pilin [Aureimonas jatrophae]MBB3952743.1 pilus assembly protein Flp/PilA [Aureimonas jatrophae]SDO71542.1 pilus assembly protein Flp/PilA [Aureimonas jatrophae]
MFQLINRFKKNSKGATAIEYGLIAALIGTAIIGAVTIVGSNLSTTFGDIGTAVETKK